MPAGCRIGCESVEGSQFHTAFPEKPRVTVTTKGWVGTVASYGVLQEAKCGVKSPTPSSHPRAPSCLPPSPTSPCTTSRSGPSPSDPSPAVPSSSLMLWSLLGLSPGIVCYQHLHSHLLHIIWLSVSLSTTQGNLTSLPNPQWYRLPCPSHGPSPCYVVLIELFAHMLPGYLCSDCGFLPSEGKWGPVSRLSSGTGSHASPLSSTKCLSYEWALLATQGENQSQPWLMFAFPYGLFIWFSFSKFSWIVHIFY